MPVTPRNETELLLLEALHQNIDEKRTPRDLYPRRVTNHVHRFLEAWESQGILDTGCAWYGWNQITTYVLKPEHVDRDMRRTALMRQVENLIIERAGLIKSEAEYRERAADLEITLRAEMKRDVSDDVIFERMEAVEDYESALQSVINAIHWREAIDEREAALRARIAAEGFDVDAVWAGHADDAIDDDADPLGGDA